MRWTKEETYKFYTGLRKYGTSFGMISLLFPNRERRHIKLKFLREEANHPELVKLALKKSDYPCRRRISRSSLPWQRQASLQQAQADNRHRTSQLHAAKKMNLRRSRRSRRSQMRSQSRRQRRNRMYNQRPRQRQKDRGDHFFRPRRAGVRAGKDQSAVSRGETKRYEGETTEWTRIHPHFFF